MKTLNELYSSLADRRRYEVWFVRLGLADGSGAWWFRYLILSPGRPRSSAEALAMPVQVWATWFPAEGKPRTFLQGFPLNSLQVSARGQSPFHLRIAENSIDESSCAGSLRVDGHAVDWDLRWKSTFPITMSDKGWIGFSRTPHSDAAFSGFITLDGRRTEGDPVGFGLQGHNCGYRHRSYWKWAHAHFSCPGKPASTLEVLFYDMPLGLTFRKVVLWHEGKQLVFRTVRDVGEPAASFAWNLLASDSTQQLEIAIDGNGPGLHRLPYLKTDCSESFEVTNNSLAKATVRILRPGKPIETLETVTGAVLEQAGRH